MVNTSWVGVIILIFFIWSIYFINSKRNKNAHSQKGGEGFQKIIQIGSPILLIIGILALISFIVLAAKRR